jgi:signal transduction histidine kinase
MFRRTLVSLTLQYSALLLLLFTLFSGTIYLYMDHTFGGDYRLSSGEQSPESNRRAAEIADIGLDRLRNGLLLSYAGLLFIVPAVSYALARRSLRPVEKSFEDQQTFVDNASHELRTPLSVVQGELELALSRPRSATAYQAAIRTSLEEVHRLTDLIAQLLLMARGSHTKIDQLAETVQFDELVQKSIATMQKLYAGKKLTFQSRLVPCSVRGISDLLSQCAYNLLDNAAKFSPKGGVIEVTLEQSNNSATLTIKDSGQGMDTNQVKQAFRRFWRADNARTVKGFGLGLSLVKQIAELHGGTVSLRSKPGEGTTLILTLPA